MNFNPSDLTKNIPDDMKAEALTQDNDDFVARCASGGVDGKQSLILSFAASLAANMHNQMMYLITGPDHPELQEMYNALTSREKVMVKAAAIHAHGMGYCDFQFHKMSKIENEAKRSLMMADMMEGFTLALETASVLRDDVSKCIATMHDRTTKNEPRTFDLGEHGRLYFVPIKKDKPAA